MNIPTCTTRLPVLALLACGLAAAVPGHAAPTTDRAELAALASRHKQERLNCMSEQALPARTDCLRDTDVAYAHAKRNRPSDIDPPYAQNAVRRCEALPGDDQRHCVARVGGQGTTTGTVAEGWIYRELIVTEPAAEPDTRQAPAALSSPVLPAESTRLAPSTPRASTTPSAPAMPSATTTPSAPSATNTPAPVPK